MFGVSDPGNPISFYDLMLADGGSMEFDNGGSGSEGVGLGGGLGVGMNMGFGVGVYRDQCLA